MRWREIMVLPFALAASACPGEDVPSETPIYADCIQTSLGDFDIDGEDDYLAVQTYDAAGLLAAYTYDIWIDGVIDATCTRTWDDLGRLVSDTCTGTSPFFGYSTRVWAYPDDRDYPISITEDAGNDGTIDWIWEGVVLEERWSSWSHPWRVVVSWTFRRGVDYTDPRTWTTTTDYDPEGHEYLVAEDHPGGEDDLLHETAWLGDREQWSRTWSLSPVEEAEPWLVSDEAWTWDEAGREATFEAWGTGEPFLIVHSWDCPGGGA
jgi:YD repeat-containing protein